MEPCNAPDCFVRRDHEISSSSPTELLTEICTAVDGLLARDDCYLIIDAPHHHRYVQVLVKNGCLYAESASNDSLGTTCAAEHGLSHADHAHLIRLGWLPPNDDSPNWHRAITEPWPWPASMVAELLVRTLVEVHDIRLDELQITVRHASRPNRRPVESDCA